ncbi:MAG TPA: hypothetical protein VJN65_07760 [Bacteroidota bacterium]|nr:hypothetical protein [Bacteroidota bacterium]
MKRINRQQGIVHHAVRRTLKELEAADGTLALAEGESYVCSYCIQPEKPCESDPQYECKDKILGETQLNRLVSRVHEVSNGLPAACSICGKTLTARDMKGNVLRELCPTCQAKSARTKRGKIEKGK